ncbi:zinc finger protein draculin [Plutella xylostella]|uniref:zinc finger protein draculin n=1 Tax=Plutella xylostella TaxID=51655 RepID=UPI0020324EAC|nr:zinc finger protein draculin [Plutella xylostella]
MFVFINFNRVECHFNIVVYFNNIKFLPIKMTSNDEGSMQWQSPVCQCCLSSTQRFYKEVASEYFWMGEKEVYEDMLLKVFSISLTSNEIDPRICELCVNKLRDASTFKKQVLRSQETLASRVVGDTLDNLIKDENVKETSAKSMDPFYRDDHNIDDTFEGTSEPMTPGVEVKEEPDTSENLRISDEETDDVKRCYPADSKRVTRSRRNKVQKSSERCENKGKTKTKKPDKCKNVKQEPLENDNDNQQILKESQMKNTTLTLLMHSNITLFNWDKNKYRCFFCKEHFLDKQLLKSHVKAHKTDEVKKIVQKSKPNNSYRAEISDLQCSVCAAPMENLQQLTSHLIKNHDVSLETEESLFMPFRIDETACQVCNVDFHCFVKLDQHMTTHFSKCICDTCGKGFRHATSLKSHINTHLKRKYVCKKCQITFVSKYQKYMHNVKEHKNKLTNMCPYCPERFSHYNARLRHLAENHGCKMPEFKCPQCDKVYITNALVRSHVRKIHMCERNYECDKCGNKYMRKSELSDHMKSHIRARDFVCSFCGKGFFRKRSLNHHLAIHVEEYRHECNNCGKTFAQKYSRNVHRKRCQGMKKS